MLRLTREVRFAINGRPDPQLTQRPTNSFGGYPSLIGFGRHLSLQVTLGGELDASSNYLINIRQIDAVVRKAAIPFIGEAIEQTPEQVLPGLVRQLGDQWPGLQLHQLRLSLSPFLSYSAVAGELPMIRLSQKFEFSATHRLHNPRLSAAENQQIFGKCNNPHGHGHNYELEVTLAGEPNNSGVLIDIPVFESLVASTVIDRFDHKNLNIELAEFRELIPTVENIAGVIHRLLKPKFAEAGAKLASVTVWETPKTWCECSES